MGKFGKETRFLPQSQGLGPTETLDNGHGFLFLTSESFAAPDFPISFRKISLYQGTRNVELPDFEALCDRENSVIPHDPEVARRRPENNLPTICRRDTSDQECACLDQGTRPDVSPQAPTSKRVGSSMHSFTRMRKVTASLPSTMR